MEESRLKRKDTTKGPPLRILSLDGGGVRGYSMLIILQELMHRTFVEIEGRAPKRNEIPKPCDVFDLIAGTGTGGLIAIMLGRLRMDIDTCKDVYVRMTKRVFETDKTIAGIPYRSTLFKASKLEEAIRDCVREHTIVGDEGNDNVDDSSLLGASPMSPMTPGSAFSGPHRSPSNASRYSQIGNGPSLRGPLAAMRWGNPNALLYDTRENRTKTAVTAVYKGTTRNHGGQILLRSYDSRKEPAPEFDCTIWQAGRATAAAALAFKPIQIGQSVFLDEGAGKYNPAPQVLEEAVCNEWPGRDVGVFISIGTGKRPPGTNTQQHLWWEGFVSGGMGDFAEARRRLISKIEGCEETHQYMLRDYLSKRRVNAENYYRFNVEVGVGEFGMNEWNRLADISTNTRVYLAKSEVQSMNVNAAAKMGKIQKAKIRWDRAVAGLPPEPSKWGPSSNISVAPPSMPLAVELPGEDIVNTSQGPRPSSQLLSQNWQQRHSSAEGLIPVAQSDELPTVVENEALAPQRHSDEPVSPYRRSGEFQYGSNPHSSNGSLVPSEGRRSGDRRRPTPPPRPPKTPIQGGSGPPPPSANLSRPPAGSVLPYPESDGPPPINLARKPHFSNY